MADEKRSKARLFHILAFSHPEKATEQIDVQRGGHDDHLELRSLGLETMDQSEQDISVQTAPLRLRCLQCMVRQAFTTTGYYATNQSCVGAGWLREQNRWEFCMDSRLRRKRDSMPRAACLRRGGGIPYARERLLFVRLPRR